MKPPRWDHLLRDQNPGYHLVGAFGTNYTQSEIGVLIFCVNRSTVDFIIPIKLEIREAIKKKSFNKELFLRGGRGSIKKPNF